MSHVVTDLFTGLLTHEVVVKFLNIFGSAIGH